MKNLFNNFKFSLGISCLINLFGAGKLIFPTKKITMETAIKTKIILMIKLV